MDSVCFTGHALLPIGVLDRYTQTSEENTTSSERRGCLRLSSAERAEVHTFLAQEFPAATASFRSPPSTSLRRVLSLLEKSSQQALSAVEGSGTAVCQTLVRLQTLPALPLVSPSASSGSEAEKFRFTLTFSVTTPTGSWVAPQQLQVGEASITIHWESRSPAANPCSTPLDPPSSHTRTQRPLLVVGAGGIGCEVIKVLILSGYRNIHLIDLDTIDGTNLNRQFLFTTEDVGKSKSFTTRTAILQWWGIRCNAEGEVLHHHPHPYLGPPPHLVAYHDNIKAPCFDEEFFGTFAVVLNALDNVSARQHVNRMCCRAGVPLLESGTMGYNGQVQPILPGVTECYDCRPKPPDQVSYAVCTIHARPTKLVHCVHFAKEMYEVLFGERQHEILHSNDEQAPAGGGSELCYLQSWRTEWQRDVERAAHSDESLAAAHRRAAVRLARCIFHDKISELLAMKSSWSTEPPVALQSGYHESSIAAEWMQVVPTTVSTATPMQIMSEFLDPHSSPPSLAALWRLFLYTTASLCATRVPLSASAQAQTIVTTPAGFRKEDDVSVGFVAATANLRAANFHLEQASLEGSRTIAGNIVPAVVTTNAMAGAVVVRQLDTLLRWEEAQHCSAGTPVPLCSNEAAAQLRTVYIRKAPLQLRRTVPSRRLPVEESSTAASTSSTSRKRQRNAESCIETYSEGFVIHPMALSCPPQPLCHACQPLERPPKVIIRRGVSLQRTTLQQLVDEVLCAAGPAGLGMEEPTICSGARILYECDGYEELGGHLLHQFASPRHISAVQGLRDQRTGWLPLHFFVEALNQDMEWEVVVCHDARANEKQSVEEEPTVVIEGLVQALEHQRQALQWRRVDRPALLAKEEDNHMERQRPQQTAATRPAEQETIVELETEWEELEEVL